MEIRHLRYFVAVAEELNFTRAAEREMVAQPSLSQQIKDLEEELEVELFLRSTRRTELSSVGRQLLPQARTILREVERFKESALRRKRGEIGELRLGAISAFANAKLADLLRRFKENHPGFQVSLEVVPSIWQAEALRSGAIDAGFLTLTEDELVGLDYREIHSGPLSLAVPDGHSLTRLDTLSWEHLRGQSMILVEPGAVVPRYYSGFLRRCRESGFEPSVTQHAPNGATQLYMVSAGLGVAPIYLPGSYTQMPGVRVLGLPPDAPWLKVLLCWRNTSPVLRRFLKVLSQVEW